MEVRQVDSQKLHRSAAGNAAAGAGAHMDANTEAAGEIIASLQHEETASTPLDPPGLLRRQRSSSTRRRFQENAKQTKWRSLVYVALVSGFLVAVARAIKCIRQETEAARTLAGSSSRKLAGGEDGECEEFSSTGSRGAGDFDDDNLTDGSGGTVSLTPPSVPAGEEALSSTVASPDDGGQSEPTISGDSESPPGPASLEESLARLLRSHVDLVTRRANSETESVRERAMVDFGLKAVDILLECMHSLDEPFPLSGRGRELLSAVEGALRLEQEALQEGPDFGLHSAALSTMLEMVEEIRFRDQAASAEEV